MRTAFIDALLAAARRDPRVMLITGDLGFGVVETFARELPDQFVNAGVAEQNMTGLAAGLALSGRIVFTYSIANFATLRALEQIRNDIGLQRAAVCITAVGGGLSYGALGPSHFATEDLAVLRAMPGLRVLAPGDPYETQAVVAALIADPAPTYLRLGRADEPHVHADVPALTIGRALQLRDGRHAALVSSGGMLAECVAAADLLAADGISVRVLSMPTVQPLDGNALLRAARETGVLLTVEEHSVNGGLGGAVAELLLEAADRPQRFRRIGLPAAGVGLVGDQAFLKQHYGLTAAAIAEQVRTLVADLTPFAVPLGHAFSTPIYGDDRV